MAVRVYTLEAAWNESNCYIVTADNKTAVAIDTAWPKWLECAKKDWGLTITHVLLTHGHFDHLYGCAVLQAKGVKIGCLDKEKELVLGDGNLAKRVGFPLEPFNIDFTFKDGDTFYLNGVKFQVIATPGHTAGSCCFLTEPDSVGTAGCLFTGDTLFCRSVGRTDLPTGNKRELKKSIQKLYALEGEYTVYPGHGEYTMLSEEREENPFYKA